MRKNSFILLSLISILTVLNMSCGSKTIVNQDNSDILVTVGDSSLTVRDVLLRMPHGLTREDSTMLFKRIVDEWVQEMVLSNYAEDNIPDMERIDEMVESYRRNLIVNRYLQLMSESAERDIPENKIKEYYDANKETMLLEQPLVKGVFVKVPANDETAAALRPLLNKFDAASIDEIEKTGTHKALKYKYFNDEWIEWNLVAEQLPVRIDNADELLRSSKIYETAEGDAIYMLRIADYMSTGSVMPYEFAKIRIADILRTMNANEYRDNLMTDIYKTQIQKGNMTPGLYDPLSGKITKKTNNK